MKNIGMMIGGLIGFVTIFFFGAVFGGAGFTGIEILYIPLLLVGRVIYAVAGPVGEIQGGFFILLIVGGILQISFYGIIGNWVHKLIKR